MKIGQVHYLPEISIVGVSLLLRLLFLNSYPPVGLYGLSIRLPTVFASCVSVYFIMQIIKKISYNQSLALLTGICLSFLPWFIEQSRIYSSSMYGLAILLTGFYLSLYFTKIKQLFIVFFTLLVFFFVNKNFWLFTQSFQLPTLHYFFNNVFKLLSGEFLFYKNDSFWSGGFRTVGVFLPSMVGFVLLGLYKIGYSFKRKELLLIVPFITTLVLGAANPLFPESREFFLSTPYWALILAHGILQFCELFRKSNIWLKIACLCYLLFFIYDLIIFGHFYTAHYSQRISQEIPYEQRDF